jgi:predicted O-methyltransferase YrrM
MTFAEEYQRRRFGPWTDIKLHLPYLRDTARSYDRVRVLELGTRRGESTAAFLAAAEETGGHVWSVDVDEPQVPAWWLDSDLWTFTAGDDMAEILPQPQHVDVLFIDTSHAYGHTIAELYKFVPRVAAGGVMLLHDTEWEPPAVQLDGPTGPVGRALDTWCAETGRSWVNRPGSYGLGVIGQPNG